MRKLIVVATLLILASAVSQVNADGVFLMQKESNLAPGSHARDITEPIQKALVIYDKGVETLVLQVSYKGSVSRFAWLVPTPSKPKVSKVDTPVFHWLHRATAPTVRYWFDANHKLYAYGYPKSLTAVIPAPGALDVQVLEKKQVGVYDIAVLRAGNAEDLLQWLRDHNYQIAPKLAPVVSDYIQRGWVFTAMRINTGHQNEVSKRLHEGVLQSLKFKFRVSEPVYPLKVSALNKGKTDILLYVLAQRRVEMPLMKTECSINYYNPYLLSWADSELPPRLTKLTAQLSPEQMTHDLLLKPAKTNDIMLTKPVSPPFLENLGASSLLLVKNTLTYPSSLIVLGCTALVALSPFGRKRWRIWIAAGIIFVIVAIPQCSKDAAMLTASRLQKNGGYAPAGIWTLVIIGIVLGSIAFSIVRNTRKRCD
ncbi:MAG: DUF2330 domain-containing protein [Armatimonadota bacterium]